MKRILSFVFPMIGVNEMYVTDPSTMCYANRLARIAPPEVESESGTAVQMALIASEGRYYSTGRKIIRTA